MSKAKLCVVCKRFNLTRPKSKYCSNECYNQINQKEYQRIYQKEYRKKAKVKKLIKAFKDVGLNYVVLSQKDLDTLLKK